MDRKYYMRGGMDASVNPNYCDGHPSQCMDFFSDGSCPSTPGGNNSNNGNNNANNNNTANQQGGINTNLNYKKYKKYKRKYKEMQKLNR